VTYTVAVSDADGDNVSWDLAVDGATLGSGTAADSPQGFTQAYDAPGNHTAVLTATDGVETVQRSLTVTITAEPAA
jgi:hypothetical protein